MKKTKTTPITSDSIIDRAHYLLNNSDIPYNQISTDTKLSFGWLINFNLNYKKGKDFGVKKVERLISYLTKGEKDEASN